MQNYTNLNTWQTMRKTFAATDSIGFVPTMGNLHQGHASLFEQSLRENTHTVASIFINPTQFNNPNDLKNYPRTLDADLKLLEKIGVEHCLLPTEEQLYPDGYSYQIEEKQDSLILEGAHRPGHFTGVLTIVMKLLQLVKPTRSYFGEKDYQQLQLIRGMIRAFFIDTEIIACPTIRETSGLACSSRNTRLSTDERLIADKFAQIFHNHAASNEELITTLAAHNITVEYLSTHNNRRLVAVRVGEIRLIDNYALNQ